MSLPKYTEVFSAAKMSVTHPPCLSTMHTLAGFILLEQMRQFRQPLIFCLNSCAEKHIIRPTTPATPLHDAHQAGFSFTELA